MRDADNDTNRQYPLGRHGNLDKVQRLAQGYTQLTPEQKKTIDSQVKTALGRIEGEPKSLAWRLRARVGDRVKWYKDVDEVQ